MELTEIYEKGNTFDHDRCPDPKHGYSGYVDRELLMLSIGKRRCK
jgi:hypothetical protein